MDHVVQNKKKLNKPTKTRVLL